jgi:hypothetical protein
VSLLMLAVVALFRACTRRPGEEPSTSIDLARVLGLRPALRADDARRRLAPYDRATSKALTASPEPSEKLRAPIARGTSRIAATGERGRGVALDLGVSARVIGLFVVKRGEVPLTAP